MSYYYELVLSKFYMKFILPIFSIMEISSYVGRRMLWDICEVSVVLNPTHEPAYNMLCNWMLVYSRQFGADVARCLPRCRATENELLGDMKNLYEGILKQVNNIHQMRTLNCLFTLTYYMMSMYKYNITLASKIASYFELITSRLRSWEMLINNSNPAV